MTKTFFPCCTEHCEVESEYKTGLKTQTKEREKIMRTLSKIMLLALLALPMGSVFAAPPTNTTLTVTVTVTIDTAINVEFVDVNPAVYARTWNVAAGVAALATTYTTTGDALNVSGDVNIRNAGTTPVKVDGGIVAGPNWTLVGAPSVLRNEAFVTFGTGTASADVVPVAATIPLTGPLHPLYTTLNEATPTAAVVISVKTPTKVSTVAAQTITITLTATAK
jgi:hypothetical protein